MEDLNSTICQGDLIDIYRTLHPAIAETYSLQGRRHFLIKRDYLPELKNKSQ